MSEHRTQHTAAPDAVPVQLSADDWRLVLDALSCCAEKPIYHNTITQLKTISQRIEQALKQASSD
jgi:hypothetical protein